MVISSADDISYQSRQGKSIHISSKAEMMYHEYIKILIQGGNIYLKMILIGNEATLHSYLKTLEKSDSKLTLSNTNSKNKKTY